MSAVLFLILGGTAAAVLVLARRGRRGATRAPLRPAGYEISELGQESFHPTQRGLGGATPPGASAGEAAAVDLGALRLEARELYLRLQRAHDIADLAAIEACTTAPLYEALRADPVLPSGSTEVAALDVSVLETRRTDEGQSAVVEFSALLREAGAGGPHAVREVWSLERSGDAAWRVGAVQELV